MFNSQDLSNGNIDVSGVTRPTNFITNDVSQNITHNDLSAHKL